MTRRKATSTKLHGCLKRVAAIHLPIVDLEGILRALHQDLPILAWAFPVSQSIFFFSTSWIIPISHNLNSYNGLSVRPPFTNSTAGPHMPPLPPAMLALMNGQNGISFPGSGPPPMRFAGPPITNNMPPGMPPPPHVNGYSSGPIPPQPPPAPAGQGAPPVAARMNPERARQLGML